MSNFVDLTKQIFGAVRTRLDHRREVRSAFGYTDTSEACDSAFTSMPVPTQDVLGDHQAKLPRLPVPPLKDTLAAYVESVKSVCPESVTSTAAVAEAFGRPGGVGEALQNALLAWDADAQDNTDHHHKPSWLESIWDDSYLLHSRDALPVNVNYVFVFAHDSAVPFDCPNKQLHRASHLTSACVHMHLRILALFGVGPPGVPPFELDMERDRPLCMSQYLRVFGTGRVPGIPRDSLHSYTDASLVSLGPRSVTSLTSQIVGPSQNHILVLCGGRMFALQVVARGLPVAVDVLEAALDGILTRCISDGSAAPNLGILTATNRDDWARAREHLSELSRANADHLVTIDSALFVLCLDELAPENDSELSRVILHGAGISRWWDKHQLIVTADGKSGMAFEHAVGDGSSTLHVFDDAWRLAEKRISAPCRAKARGGSPKTDGDHRDDSFEQLGVQELVFDIDSDIKRACSQAFESFRELVLAVDTSTFRFSRFGGSWIKSHSFSPDAFVQVAMQVAYYNLYGCLAPAYESASTKQFLHGRTETVRSATVECLELAKSLKTTPLAPLPRGAVLTHTSESMDSPRLLQLLRTAASRHVEVMQSAKRGFGVDRHLLGLRVMADLAICAQEGTSLEALDTAASRCGCSVARKFHEALASPALAALRSVDDIEFFRDSSYRDSALWRLSTSHCGSPSLSYFGFGPVISDGYGIGYMIRNDVITFMVTARHGDASASAMMFCSAVCAALCGLETVVISNSKFEDPKPKALDFSQPTVSVKVSYMDLFKRNGSSESIENSMLSLASQ